MRHHAWTDELIAVNHLSSEAALVVGQRIRIRTAQRYHVDPELALAVSWQEAGWQQDRVSSAHAIGAMQVLSATGRGPTCAT